MSLKRKHKAEEPNDLTATDVMEFIQLRVGMPLCELIELKKSIDAEVDRRLEDGLWIPIWYLLFFYLKSLGSP